VKRESSCPVSPLIEGVYFVTRLKDNADYRPVKRLAMPADRNIPKDEMIQFAGFYAHRECPHLLRRVEVLDKEDEEVIVSIKRITWF